MSKVLITKDLLDDLADAVAEKSGESTPLTIEEMTDAVESIVIPSAGTEGTPVATKGTVSNHSISVTPSVTNTGGVIQGGTHTGTAVSVSASELVSGTYTVDSSGTKDVTNYASASVPSGTAGTPSATKGTVSNHSVTVTPSVTNSTGWITGSTKTGTAVTVSASELVSGTYTAVTSYGTYDVTNYASVQVPGGSEGIPTATKGTVSNHSVSITPSVTNVNGYITGSTKTGTAVTVTASELASGNKEITQNGTGIDVVGYSTVSVNVSGGGGSSVAVDTVMRDAGGDEYTAIFTGLKGEPTSFAIYVDDQVSPSATAVISSIVYDGSSTHIQTITNTSNAQVSYASSGASYTYNNGTLTVTSSSLQFVDIDYVLIYSYGGSSANIHTADVQVGSGATSITFTGLEDEPLAWYCIFKSNFGTSSGYQRVIFTEFDGNGSNHVAGLAMDSSAHPSSAYWSYSYNNGSLTITSSGTNAGGYFHQPGYYQLTYVIGEASPYEKVSKTYRASTTAQSEKIEPSTGYDAMSEVNISIPAVTQTNLTAANIKSGTTVTISNGSTNLWSVTGTYSGGGGSANIATATTTNSNNQSTSISFTLPSGRTPIAFFARLTSQIARNSNSRYYYVFDMRWDGSSTGGVEGNTFYMYNGTLTNVTSGYSYSQSGTTFTLSSTGSRSASPGSFYNGDYELVYIY